MKMLLKCYKYFLILLAINIVVYCLYPTVGQKSETMIKLMGEKSEILGILIAFFLGSAAAARYMQRFLLYIYPPMAGALLYHIVTPQTPERKEKREKGLSDREREVLKYLALGHTNQDIADLLHISVKTVETYKTRVMEKLDLRKRAELVRYAMENGMIND